MNAACGCPPDMPAFMVVEGQHVSMCPLSPRYAGVPQPTMPNRWRVRDSGGPRAEDESPSMRDAL